MVRIRLPKVSPPGLEGYVPRPRVSSALAEIARGASAWVQAPGGSGKTSAVAAFALALKRPVAWMHLDAGDAEPATYFRYLGMAVQGALGKSSTKLPAHAPEFDADIALFARRHARAILEAAPAAGITIVFDNVHDLPAGSAVHEAIAVLGEELVPGAVLLLASRVKPGQQYAHLIAQGLLRVLPSSTLAFTEPELKEVLRSRGLLDERSLASLWERSRGWIAGALLLAFQSEGGAGEPEDAGGDFLFGYFATQLLARLPADDRTLLLRTAYLSTVQPEVAARLSGIADAGERLARFAVEGVFTVRLSTEPMRFRYHDLLREALREEVGRRLGGAQLRELKLATAREMAQSGEAIDSLELLAASEEWDVFAQVAAQHAERILDSGFVSALRPLLQRVPRDRLRGDAWLLYWLGQCQLAVDDGQAAECLSAAHALFGERGDAAGQLVAAADVPGALINQFGDRTAYGEWVARLESLLEESNALESLSSNYLALKVNAALVGELTASRTIEGRLDKVVASIIALNTRVRDPNLKLQALTNVARLGWRYRRTDLMPQVVELAARDRLGELASPLIVLHWLLEVITFDSMYGDPGRARSNGELAERLAEETGLPQARVEALYLRLEAACDANDLGLVRALLDRLEASVDPTRPFMRAGVAAFRARSALLRNDPQAALAACADAVAALDVAGQLPRYRSAYCQIEVGAHALRGDWPAALAAADRYRPQFQPNNQAIVDVDRLWILAAQTIEAGAGDARERLAEAVRLARETKFPLFLRHANAIAARLAAQALAWNLEPEFMVRAILHRGLRPPDADTPGWPWPVRIRCLGAFELEIAGHQANGVARQQKPLQLLQSLVALGGRDVPAAKLIALLWPGEGRVGAQQAFDTTLHRLRRLLDSDEALAYEDRHLGLHPDVVWVDALRLETRLAELDGRMAAGATLDEVGSALQRLTTLYRGHFLPGAGEAPWAAQARDRLWSRLRVAMLAYAQAASRAGDTDRALQTCFFVADLDPLAEDAIFGLMVTFSSRGQNVEALRAYERCALALQAQLGAAPSERLRTLAAAIRASA